MCMARLNVYVPDELASAARDAGLNVSALTRSAIGQALRSRQADAWLDGFETTGSGPTHASVIDAIDAARAELDG